jgi:dihydrofolate synthase / folylpolyglutamate synthase
MPWCLPGHSVARSDAILDRLLALHPKIIDLGLERMERVLKQLGNPERKLPPVIHVAGTNGKGSTVAFVRAIMEAANLKVHCYTSPHLVKFHERIVVAGETIPEQSLSALLEECEAANGPDAITFFEITTAAAFLAFARTPADYLILEVGLGGRLDATNVAHGIIASVITTVDYDHQQYLGETLTLIAREKAGILRKGVPAVIAAQPDEARAEIERVGAGVGAPLVIANQEWQAYEQHGRLIYQDDAGLLDLPMPALKGRHRIDNAGNAVAAMRLLNDARIGDREIAEGLKQAQWPARMQRLGAGRLFDYVPRDTELWLDGGHNPSAARALARAFSEINERRSRPLILIWGLLNSKDAARFVAPFVGLAERVVTLAIPGEANAVPAAALAAIAREQGLDSLAAPSLEAALQSAAETADARILICGSLYLAGHVLATHSGEEPSRVSGAARR